MNSEATTQDTRFREDESRSNGAGGEGRDQVVREARRHVKRLKGFYTHAAAYVAVNTGLVAMNWIGSPDEVWAIWPVLGWGIGLASHAAKVFRGSGGTSDWEARKMREYIRQRELESGASSRLQGRATGRREGESMEAFHDRLVRRIEHLEAIVTDDRPNENARRDNRG